MDHFRDGFVDVYSKTTGVKQTVPEHYLDHPILGADFARTPSSVAAEARTSEPSMAWNRSHLDEYAAGIGLATEDLATKTDVLNAIADAPAGDTPNPDGTPPTDQTPSAGENQE